ncbi:hypothetical protein PEC18_35860 [Paucibacter sp. O1-1]|nr:hypothetical protein [Paucibacter sp. O1-1]MDA3831034.1 hypothetical protein [Paucibacter sp. O1-1]
MTQHSSILSHSVDAIIRPLTAQDDAALAAVIREVSAEYGLTPDKGFSVADKTLDRLSEVYQAQGSQYWVIEYQGKVVGGAGVAALAGNIGVCELQKCILTAPSVARVWLKSSHSNALHLLKISNTNRCI